MKYLGAMRGQGTLAAPDEALGAAAFDIEGYLLKPGGDVVASGEDRMAPEDLARAFGRPGLLLTTDDGRVLSVRFTARKLPAMSDSAHADIGGDLPKAKAWGR